MDWVTVQGEGKLITEVTRHDLEVVLWGKRVSITMCKLLTLMTRADLPNLNWPESYETRWNS